MSWNFDISTAPKGKMVTRFVKTKDGKKACELYESDRIILATKCGKVTTSYWLPESERWCMLSGNEEPVAWMPWPSHPSSQANREGEEQ